MFQVLLVEDDRWVGQALESSLRVNGYQMQWTTTGRQALAEARKGAFDLVLLDLGLRDMDGVDVCRRLRVAMPQCVLMILTARQDEMNVVVCLEAGADDYLTKPIRLGELLARMRARLRCGPVSRDTLITEVWDAHWCGPTNTLDVHIGTLRRKLAAIARSPDTHPRSRRSAAMGTGWKCRALTPRGRHRHLSVSPGSPPQPQNVDQLVLFWGTLRCRPRLYQPQNYDALVGAHLPLGTPTKACRSCQTWPKPAASFAIRTHSRALPARRHPAPPECVDLQCPKRSDRRYGLAFAVPAFSTSPPQPHHDHLTNPRQSA